MRDGPRSGEQAASDRTAGAARAAGSFGIPILLIGALTWPMLLTSAEFNQDWGNHLWYMWNQSLAILADHRPTYFLNYSHSVFYPVYAFYAGTLYAIVGTLSLALGNAPIAAYVLAYLLDFLAAYGGWLWMARMAGLRGWRAHAPGVIFITSAYYLTLIYARGDLPEFTGVSMVPLVVAAGLSVLRADRLRLWPALALAGGSVVFFGSHNLTVVWASTLIALMGALVAVCIPQARGWLTRGGVLRVASLAIPGCLVNAWFLLPALAYQSHTRISDRFPHWQLLLKASIALVSAHNLFTLSRASFALPGDDFALALPILALAWSAIGCLVFIWKGARGAWLRLLAICLGLTMLTVLLMTHAALVLALPRPFAMLQYPYRLESYVILCACGAVLALLVLAGNGARGSRIWSWTLVPILLTMAVGAIQQTGAYPHRGDRNLAVKPRVKPGPRELGFNDYTDGNLTLVLDRHGRPPEVDFPAASVHDDRASKVVHLQPGTAVYTNIAGGPELVHVTGARIIGIDPERNDVLEIGPSRSRGQASAGGASAPTEVIALSAAAGAPVVLGRLLSLAAAVFLVVLLAVLAVGQLALGRERT